MNVDNEETGNKKLEINKCQKDLISYQFTWKSKDWAQPICTSTNTLTCFSEYSTIIHNLNW